MLLLLFLFRSELNHLTTNIWLSTLGWLPFPLSWLETTDLMTRWSSKSPHVTCSHSCPYFPWFPSCFSKPCVILVFGSMSEATTGKCIYIITNQVLQIITFRSFLYTYLLLLCLLIKLLWLQNNFRFEEYVFVKDVWPPNISFEQTNISLMSCAAAVIAAIVFSKGAPYRKPLFTNGIIS